MFTIIFVKRLEYLLKKNLCILSARHEMHPWFWDDAHPWTFSFAWPFPAEAGYVATPIAMVQAAMTLLNDASDLPKG